MTLKDRDRLVDSNNEEASLSRRRFLASTTAGVASALVATQATADTLADVPPREVGADLSGHGERSKFVWLSYNDPAWVARRHGGAAGMEAAVQTMTGALKAIATEATSASPKK
jgi:sulfane dehydrogenase subunit SoxC